MALPLIGGLLSLAEKVIDKVIPDPVAKQAAILELAKLEQSGDLAAMAQQVELDKIDAASADRFQSRWRPFIGWVCGGALAIQLCVGPLLTWMAALAGYHVVFPAMQTELLTTLLVGMLGLGGMRTVEKLNGRS